jgi:hypothetical protein
MLAYFARLLIRGVITALLSFMLIHTVVSYTPGGPAQIVQELRVPRYDALPPYRNLIDLWTILELELPWPLSSLAWLFDPTENERLSAEGNYISTGININIAGIPIRGSGVLTGDFAHSLTYKPGVPVMDIIGKGKDQYLLAYLAVLFVAMIIACVQRRGRPKLHELPIRLLPSMAAPRCAVQASAMYNWHNAGPLSGA